jgi:DNA-binding HxlR family transcriptional regulator
VLVEVDYSLTTLSPSLWPVLTDMQTWAWHHKSEFDSLLGIE